MCFSLRRITRLLGIVPLAAIVLNASAASAQSPLGSAQSFAVLGAETATNTGATPPTMITGDVGVSPGTAITGFPPGVVLGGAIHAGDPVAARAHTDALLAYVRLAGFDCPSINHLSGVLGTGGLHATLPTGVYCFDTSAQLTGTLTLTSAVTLDTNKVSVCSSGSGPFPPAMDKCEEHHDKDRDDHDHDKGKDKDHKDHDSKDKKRG
jgi:hypothetical protein